MREKISVLVLTYNPSKQKLIATLKSIIKQENVDIQVIVSDDGSKENYFEEAKEFLEKNNFTDYKFVNCEKNQGTVKNAIRAVGVSNGEYVKLISPGDMFTSNNVLRNWLNHLIQSKYKDGAFFYIPVQSGKMRELPFSTVTFCLHPNMMSEKDFEELNEFIYHNQKKFKDLVLIDRKKNIYDRTLSYIYFKIKKLKAFKGKC